MEFGLLVLICAGIVLLGISSLSYFSKKITSELLVVAPVVGVVLVSLSSFFFGFLHLPALLLNLLLGIFIVFSLAKNRPTIDISRSNQFISLLLILIGVFLLSCRVLLEGFKGHGDLVLYSGNAHDALWHIGLQEALKRSIPPDNPVYSGIPLKGYHYLTDIFLNWVGYITHIPTTSLYITWAPILLSILFCLTTLFLMFEITKNKLLSYLGYSILIFGSSLAWIAPLLFHNASSVQSAFWMDQTTDHIINQQLLLSFSIVNVILLLSIKSVRKWWVILSILLGSLIGVKVYASILLFPAFGILGVYYYFKAREWRYLATTVVGLLISLPILLIVGSGPGKPFIFDPGWFIVTMYTSNLRLNNPVWELKRQVFLAHDNWRRLFILWSEGVLVFFFGNFGFKLLSLAFLPNLIKNFKKFKNYGDFLVLTLTTLLLSFLLPMLFIQKGVSWNTIQFLFYAQVPIIILALMGGELLFKSRYLALILILFLVTTLPTTYQSLSVNFSRKSYITYDSGLIKSLQTIKQQNIKGRLIVGAPLYETSLVPAITTKQAFLVDPIINDILVTNYQPRIDYIGKLESGKTPCRKDDVLILSPNSQIAGRTEILGENSSLIIYRCL